MALPSGIDDICKEVDVPPAHRLVRARLGPLATPAVLAHKFLVDARLLFLDASWLYKAM
eukprot:m.28690 g.28690  ORF g.28690 m.28690 type:complete len:59 (-) comp13625_c0_seq1:213-389(-)